MPSRPQWLATLTQHGPDPPYLLKYRSAEGFIVGTIALAVFTDMFLYAVIVPVVPFALQTRSHVAPDRVQYWVSVLIAVYGGALLAFSPICGWLADHTSSRRSPLLIGLFALLGATIMLNVGSSTSVWVAGRVLQGISAAVVWVVGLALLADTVPQQRLGQSLGYVGAGMSIGILVAPLLGGVVFDRGGYNAVFGMAYALVGIDIILRIALVEKKVAARWLPATEEPNGSAVRNSSDEASNAESSTQQTDPDPEKAISASHTAAGGSKEITEEGSQAAETTTPIETQEAPINTPSRKRVRSRLPPVISLLYSRRLLSALFGALIQAALVTAFDSVLTIRAAQIFDWSSTGAALLFLPIVIPTFTAPAIGWLMDRIGPRYPAALGFLVALPPFVCLRYVRENTLRDKVLLCVLLALIGLSLTFTFPPLMAEIAGVVEAKEKKMLANGEKGWGKGGAYAQAYGLFNMAFAGGCLVGPLLAGFVVEQSGWATMGWVLGLLSAVTFVPTLLWMGGWIGEKR